MGQYDDGQDEGDEEGYVGRASERVLGGGRLVAGRFRMAVWLVRRLSNINRRSSNSPSIDESNRAQRERHEKTKIVKKTSRG